MTAWKLPPSRWRVLTVRSALSAGVLAIVFSSIAWTDVGRAWDAVSWPGVLAATVLLPLQIGMRIMRWRSLLHSVASEVAFGQAARTVLAGYAFAVVTPAEVGDVAFRMQRHDDVGRARIAGVVALEKLLHSLLSLVPGLPALILAISGNVHWTIVAFALMLAVIAAVIFGHHAVRRIQIGVRWPRLKSVDEALTAFSSVPRRVVAGVIGWTCGILIVYTVQEFALVNAVTTLGPVATWNAFWAGIGLRTLAPFFIMDLGIREASHVAFFGPYGVDAASATAVSLLMFFVNVLVPTIIGLAVFLADRRRSA